MDYNFFCSQLHSPCYNAPMNTQAKPAKRWQPLIRKGLQRRVTAAAKRRGQTMTRWLEEAITEKLEREARQT